MMSIGPSDTASPAFQARNRALVQAALRTACFDYYDDQGQTSGPREREWRGRLWLSLAFLNGEDAHIQRANAMLRVAVPMGGGHFWSSAVTSALAHFSDRLDADVRNALATRLHGMIAEESLQRFRGYNDNFPAMAALAALVGGPLVGNPEGLAGGRESLRGLRSLLTRRGMLSEYGSPTYTPITLTCLAEIVEFSPDAESRELARWAEGRIWMDLLSRYHPATSFIAGPHSRAYAVDLCAHFHNAHTVLHQILGNRVFVNPLSAVANALPGQVLHGTGLDFLWSHVAWQSTPTYHVPAEALALALEPPGRRTVRASSEQAAFPRGFWKDPDHPRTPLAEFAAGEMHTHTHLREDFAVGTSDRPFLDGYQHTGFHVVYRRNAPASSLRDIATLFPRYLIDNKAPARTQHVLLDEGRTLSVAHEGAALVTYRAKPQWGTPSHTPDWQEQPVRSLKLSIVCTCFWGQPEEIWLGERKAQAWEGESAEPCPVFLRDGTVFIALHPLLGCNHGRDAAVRLESNDGFGLASFINYEGAPRTFRDEELFATHNGFVAEVSAATDWTSFEAFRRFHSAPRIHDQYAPGDRMRHVRYEREGLSLELEASPVSDGIKFAAINGELAPCPHFDIQDNP